MRIEQLRYFVKAIDCKSINKAAEYFYIAQPAMSDALKKLEAEVGAPLLNKNYAGVTLTLVGQEFYKASVRILEILEDAQKKAEELQALLYKEPLRNVRFAISHGVSLNIMPQLLNQFRLIQPHLEVTISEKNAQSCVRRIIDNQADCGIVFIYENEFKEDAMLQMFKEHELYVKCLRQYKAVALVGKQHLLAKKQQVGMTELIKYPFALINTNFDSRCLVENFKGNPKITFEIITDNSNLWVEYLCNHDRTVGIAPDFQPFILEKYDQQICKIDIKASKSIIACYICAPHLQEHLYVYEKIIENYIN